MALIHELERSGNWLFRRRSWLPVILIAPGLVIMYYVNRQAILYNLNKELVFLGISLFGELVRVMTVGFAPGNTSGRNTAYGQLADEINMSGIYSVVRHPLYIGNYFMWLGPVLFIRSAWFAVVFSLVYWIYYERIMFAEEQFLRRKFEEAYDRWSEKVGAILPSFRNYIPPTLTFSIKTVLRREYNSFINIFIIFAIIDVVRNYIISRRVSITPFWGWMLAGAILVWIVLRMIHKTTSYFTVEGR